jgi:siderophore synthetase component
VIAPPAAAHAYAVETLLNCWVRETGAIRGLPKPGPLTLRLERLSMDLTAELVAWSPSGRHRWNRALLGGVTLDPITLAALLAREAGGAGDVADLVVRVADSVTRTSRFLETRAQRPVDPVRCFLDAEQALVLGHPLHPTPNSRTGFTDEECARYSPEMRGMFPLHWFSVDREVVAEDSALDRPATALLAGLVDVDPGQGRVLLPAHPWQARQLATQPHVEKLLGDGRLRDLGELGPPWYPTSSVRTLYRPDIVMMLKVSLALPITNSVRRNLRKELIRGVEIHRLLGTRLGHELRARFPDFDIVRDPAWATVEPAEGADESGFEVLLRDNPWQAGGDTDAACVAALCSDRPDREARAWLLAEIVNGLACAEGRAADEVARDWWARYLDVAARPLIWLYAAHGIALEAHQQNSVVLLENGWPAGFRYRDNQGYYVANSAAERLSRLLPGFGAASDIVCEDALADERFGYYFGINHLFGMVGAFGAAELADETDLLAELKAFFEGVAAALPRVPGMLEALLDAPTLRCKANLLTRVEGLDELVGPVETQSVYVDIPNPLREVSRARRGRGRDWPVQPRARRPARPRRGRRRGLL